MTVEDFLDSVRLVDADVSWHDRAACAGLGIDRFFSAGPKTKVVAICEGCPVRERCLEWATTNGIVDGVWGGQVMSQNQRGHTVAG